MAKPKTSQENHELIYLFLLHMDGYSWNKGSRRLETALQYLLELEIPEDHQVKEIYAEVAKRTGGDWRAAERSLRYGIQRFWRLHSEECSTLFYRCSHHTECPCVSEFLIMFHTANERGSLRLWIETVEGRSLSIYGNRRIGSNRRHEQNGCSGSIESSRITAYKQTPPRRFCISHRNLLGGVCD